MRSSLLLVAVLAALTLGPSAAPVRAQAPPPASTAGPKLSPAQQARYQARMQKFNKDAAAVMANKSLTPAQQGAKIQAMKKALDPDMLAILTPAQRAQVLAQRKGMMAQQKAMMAKAQAFKQAHSSEIKTGQALAAKLTKSLTPAQKSQIAAIQKQVQQQYQTLATNKSLTQQAKMQQMQGLNQQAQAKITAILNPTQKADYLKMQQMQKQLMSEAGRH
jgi:hypothetical protein